MHLFLAVSVAIFFVLLFLYYIKAADVEENYNNYLKKPLSRECHDSIPVHRKILNPINPLEPVLKFSNKDFSARRSINAEDFKKNILNKINIDNIPLVKNLKELENPKTNIYEKPSWNKLPENEYKVTLSKIKSKIDQAFKVYLSGLSPTDPNIKCPNPDENCTTKIIEPGIIKIMENDQYYLFTLQFTWYIKDKSHGYVIGIECYCNKKSLEIKIKKLELIGIKPEQEINLLSGPGPYQNRVNIYKRFPEDPYKASETYLRDSNDFKIKYTGIDLIKYFGKKNKDKKEAIVTGTCKTPDGGISTLSKIECEAATDELGRLKDPGTHDKSCVTNLDCPFYKANKNYPNERGGCKSGICELPVNMVLTGAVKYDLNKPAYCHNCPEDELDCCLKQQDRNPLMLSPDYAFVDDLNEREIHKETLLSKGLMIN